MNDESQNSGHPDPLIDDVRRIRRAVCAEFGNDVEKLVEHLELIEREYITRTGRFAGVPRKSDGELFKETAQIGASNEDSPK